MNNGDFNSSVNKRYLHSMKTVLFLLALLTSSRILLAQEPIVTYSRDVMWENPVKKAEKAFYRMETRDLGDGRTSTEVYRILDNKLVQRREYHHDRPSGKWVICDKFANIGGEVDYDDLSCPERSYSDSLREAVSENRDPSVKAKDSVGDGPVFTVVEKMPEFPGGQQALYSFIGQNVSYPRFCQDQSTEGIVYISFVVDKDGSVIDACVLRGTDPLLDQEALRVIRLMPQWSPGEQRGKTVKVSYILPVKFSLK